MSYGSLGEKAVRALARGARKAGIPMNTGGGGFPKHHLEEGADLIFQMGTAKFGVRNEDGRLDEARLEALCRREEIKMVEIKLSQGAKPGKGGLLPREKVSEEIAELRGVPRAAPRSFMDGVGLPLFAAIPIVREALEDERVLGRTHILASGKLIDAHRQLVAMAMGASATYTARGFLLAIGCIQALQCNQNTCPVGITTHDPWLQRGLDIEEKSERVARYAGALCKEQGELLAAMGVRNREEPDVSRLHLPRTPAGRHP